MSADKQSRPFHQSWIESALEDMGVATIVTDARGSILFMNSVAESLTGWTYSESVGRLVASVFRIEREDSRLPVADLVGEVLSTGMSVGISNHITLVARDGTEWILDDGAAPIMDETGTSIGAVLVFRDVGERRRGERAIEDARAFSEGIIGTLREPLLVIDAGLRVRIANQSFYRTFGVTQSETEGQLFFELGNNQWDVPPLREMLEEVLLRNDHFNDCKLEHEFQGLGRRSMILNARRLPPPLGGKGGLILLAIEDATERLKAIEALELSEVRYRRLFETAQDGILLVDPITGQVFDANPFLIELLGRAREELIGKELWEIGLFTDIESNKAAFRTLQTKGYIRYDDLPLRTYDDRAIEVEFVSNVYDVGKSRVIQCNIRDVTDRKRVEEAIRIAHADLEVRVQERTAELALTNAVLTDEISRREVAEADRRELQQQLATAQEDERRRIARELHDQMGQHLAALGLGLEAIKSATPDPSTSRDRLQSLQSLTDLIGREVHQLALELRPTALDDLGVHAALANYAEGWSERSRIQVDFHSNGLDGVRLPPLIETTLYRVVQEALTNVLKHARATRVSVVLQRSQGQVSALVEDNGKGFDIDAPKPATPQERRLGFLGMQERMALVGGMLTIESNVGQGTTIITRIPILEDVGNA